MKQDDVLTLFKITQYISFQKGLTCLIQNTFSLISVLWVQCTLVLSAAAPLSITTVHLLPDSESQQALLSSNAGWKVGRRLRRRPTFQPALGNTPWQSDSHSGWLILPELNCSSPIASSSSIHSAITHLQASPWGARGIISHSSTWKISAQPRKQRGRKASQIQFKLSPSNEWHKKEQQRC